MAVMALTWMTLGGDMYRYQLRFRTKFAALGDVYSQSHPFLECVIVGVNHRVPTSRSGYDPARMSVRLHLSSLAVIFFFFSFSSTHMRFGVDVVMWRE